jgi:hypothetical protein
LPERSSWRCGRRGRIERFGDGCGYTQIWAVHGCFVSFCCTNYICGDDKRTELI